ncbi:MAG: dephospho-CoA kinase, partial [Thermoprotei archaeon]
MEDRKKKVILVTGMPGSGKSIVYDVAKKLGFGTVSMGDVVREEVKKRGLKPTRENMSRVAKELRKKEGMHAIAIRILDEVLRLLSSGIDLVVVDGIRGYEEVEYLRGNLDTHAKLLILTVHAS